MEEFCATNASHRSHQRQRPASPTKTAWITSPLARRLAHLALHKTDLDFAETALLSLPRVPRDQPVLGEMAWRMAVLYTMKCFVRHPSRVHLDERTVFRDDGHCREVFSYFRTMRDRLFVHDENAYSDCRVGLVINGPQAPRKVEAAKVFAIPTATLAQTDQVSLYYLIKRTLEWVTAEIDRVAQSLTSDYENRTYAELNSAQDVETPPPAIREIRLGWDGGGR